MYWHQAVPKSPGKLLSFSQRWKEMKPGVWGPCGCCRNFQEVFGHFESHWDGRASSLWNGQSLSPKALPFRQEKFHPCTTSPKGFTQGCPGSLWHCLQSKVDSWLSAHSSLKHLSRYKSHLRIGPLLSGGISEQKLSLCVRASNWHSPYGAWGDGPCCPSPVSPHLEGA